MSAQHTPGPVGAESDGRHWATVGRASVENSAILRGIERRKAEREAMRAALVQASSFTETVERFMRADDDRPPLTESEVAEAMYALRAAIAKATGSAQ